jgi:hypothetical protein
MPEIHARERAAAAQDERRLEVRQRREDALLQLVEPTA